MANPIRIKRSTSNAAPASLNNAELSYSEGSDILYYGKGTGGAGGTATTIVPIAGNGAVLTLANTAQTVIGPTTFTQPITGSVTGNAATSTRLATGRTITLTGDVTAPGVTFDGTTNISLTTALPNSGIVAGTYLKTTFNAKGIATAGAAATLNDLGAPTATYSMNNQKLTGLPSPSVSTDAATKQYVDDLASGLKVKTPARVATTANLSSISGLQTIDNIVLVANDRVLVKDQTTQALNGIYLAAAGTWSRALDADTWDELVSAYILVSAGTTNQGVSFVTQISAGGTLGTTAIPWAQFSTPSTYSAGNGLTLSGTQFSVALDGVSLTASGSGLRLSSVYAGQNTITTLGTVSTGTWQAGTVDVAHGGTGTTSFTANALLKANTTSTGALITAIAVPNSGGAGDYLDSNSVIDGGTY